MTNTFKTAASVTARLALATMMASISLGAAVVPAKAATVTRTISARGLDLSSASGRAVMVHRVAIGAHKVCSELAFPGGDTTPAAQDCTADAFKDGFQQVQRLFVAAPRP